MVSNSLALLFSDTYHDNSVTFDMICAVCVNAFQGFYV